MKHKYFMHKECKRYRVEEPQENYLQMHRNTKVDFYSQEFEDMLKKSLSFKNFNRYPDMSLLYKKLSTFHSINESNILLTSGIDGGLKTVFEMCTQKDSNIICLTPTYGMYYVYADVYNVNMLPITSKADTLKINIDELLNQLNESIDILFLPNPHEPIENIFSLEEINLIMIKAKQFDILVFIDEAYYMFGSPTAIHLISTYENLIVARTFSKGIGLPAIRLGYLIANEKLITYLHSKRLSYEVNSLTIDIAMWTLDNLHIFEDYIEEVCESREWIKQQLHKFGYQTHGNQSNTMLINLNSKEKANNITKALKDRNILVRGYLPQPAEKYISVTIGSKKLMNEFINVFKELVGSY